MKTISINLYQFNELSPEAQQAAIANLSDINTTNNWWDSTYEDAANIGLKITGFDVERNAINCHFLHPAAGDIVAQNILENHGAQCDTYKLASSFMEKIGQTPYADGYETEETKFLKQLSAAYLDILRKEHEQRTSDESIKETITEANEYYFFENGQLYVEAGN